VPLAWSLDHVGPMTRTVEDAALMLNAIAGHDRDDPWSAAEPVEVAPALRTTGTLTNRGRVRPVADPSWLRAERQRAQAEALAVHDGLRASLATSGAVRLSSFGRLPADAFAELLALLTVGLDAPVGADGARRALSLDGRVEVVLHDPGDGHRAVLCTSEGTLEGPDLSISITLVGDAVDTDTLSEACGG
jgi:uncharacterized protein (TIGR02677 family)